MLFPHMYFKLIAVSPVGSSMGIWSLQSFWFAEDLVFGLVGEAGDGVFSLVSETGDGVFSLASETGNSGVGGIKLAVVFIDVGEDEVVVNPGGTLGGGVEKEHEETELEEVVEGDPGEDEARKMVKNVEEAEDNPVSKPLFVILATLALESQEAHEHGVSNSEEASDVVSAHTEHHEEDAGVKSVLGQLLDLKASDLSNFFHFLLREFVEVLLKLINR